MVRINNFLLAFFLIFIATGCEKKEYNSADEEYLIFGHFYGECFGESCIEIFKLTPSDIFEDRLDKYPDAQNPYQGDYIKRDLHKHQQVGYLLYNVPAALLSINQKVIGMPDAGDWGGFYIEIKHRNEPLRYWLLDKNKNNVPSSLYVFMDEMDSCIKMMQ